MIHTMTCDEFEAALPRLLDGEIEMTPTMQAHLHECTVCTALLADLRMIQERAATLPALEPERDLWAGISARVEAPVVSLANSVTVPTHLRIYWRAVGLAAAALVVLTAGITYEVTRRNAPEVATTTPLPTLRSPLPTISLVANLPANYDNEVSRLHAIVDSNRRRLDPATVALLERNLRMIDSAIVQCRDALAKDPASKFLMQSLNDSYKSKVQLLRMAAAATKG